MTVRLEPGQRALLAAARRATLATVDADGRPRLVPCCFVLLDTDDGPVLLTPIDEKPKRSADPRELARVRDIQRDPRVTLLVDRWDEDWTRLAWLRLAGDGMLLWPTEHTGEHVLAVAALRARYPQYVTQALESLPLIRVHLTSVRSWTATAAAAAPADAPPARPSHEDAQR